MPHEIALGEVFAPPLVIVNTVALVLAFGTVTLLNRYRLSRFFVAPSLVFVGIAAIYAMLIGTFVIPI